MDQLRPIELKLVDELFGMSSGYVLDFSNSTFADFFCREVGLDIYDEAYAIYGTSKGKHLRAFLTIGQPKAIAKALAALGLLWLLGWLALPLWLKPLLERQATQALGRVVTLDSLTLREHVVAADYLAFDQRGGVAQRIALIASMAGTDEALIKKLHGVDYQRAEREVDRMLREDEAAAEDKQDAEKAVEKK